MKKILFILLIGFVSCDPHVSTPNELVVSKISMSDYLSGGKYFVIIANKYNHAFFYTNKDYKIGDTLTACNCHEYQMDINQDSIRLYDDGRKVGSLSVTKIGQLDSLLLNDNQ